MEPRVASAPMPAVGAAIEQRRRARPVSTGRFRLESRRASGLSALNNCLAVSLPAGAEQRISKAAPTPRPPVRRQHGGRPMKRTLYILGLLNDKDIDWLLSAGSKGAFANGTTLVRE